LTEFIIPCGSLVIPDQAANNQRIVGALDYTRILSGYTLTVLETQPEQSGNKPTEHGRAPMVLRVYPTVLRNVIWTKWQRAQNTGTSLYGPSGYTRGFPGKEVTNTENMRTGGSLEIPQ